MSRSIKYVGFKGWFVLDESGDQVAGPFAEKPRAEAVAAEDPKPSPQFLSEAERERAYLKRMNDELRAEKDRICGKVRNALLSDFDADTVAMMMRQIEPIIAAGKEGGRRERPRIIAPVRAAAA